MGLTIDSSALRKPVSQLISTAYLFVQFGDEFKDFGLNRFSRNLTMYAAGVLHKEEGVENQRPALHFLGDGHIPTAHLAMGDDLPGNGRQNLPPSAVYAALFSRQKFKDFGCIFHVDHLVFHSDKAVPIIQHLQFLKIVHSIRLLLFWV